MSTTQPNQPIKGSDPESQIPGQGNDQGHSPGQGDENKQAHKVTITVNEQPVEIEGKTATGAQIIGAAIQQGVHIQANFILQEELPNGTSRIIGPNDVVELRPHLRFTAIAPDDNS